MKDSDRVIDIMTAIKEAALQIEDKAVIYEIRLLHNTMDTIVHNLQVNNK